MTKKNCVLRIAVATPLRRLFDYYPDTTSHSNIKPGVRVSIPFGRKKDSVGIIVEIAASSDFPASKIKKINAVIDKQPLIDKKHLDFLSWASRYYHHPIGEVIFNSLPSLLRGEKNLAETNDYSWKLSNSDQKSENLKLSDKQQELYKYLKQQNQPVHENKLLETFPRYKPTLQALYKNKLVTKIATENERVVINETNRPFKLNDEQKSAVDSITHTLGTNTVHLLDGVTGSGKTEVYMSLIEAVLKQDKQCLVLLPEIGLTPQIIERFKARFNVNIAIQHSGLSDKERLRYWQSAKNGSAKLILGTRSAVWTPLTKPGLYIIDEEHDLSYKQQDGFRYSARDMLIARAKRDSVPVILGSATPSLESAYNVNKNRYTHHLLPNRAGNAKLPNYRILDIRGKQMHGALSHTLIEEIKDHLSKKKQVLIFLNRRGYAVHLYCHQCAWRADCSRCEIPYTYHKKSNRLHCHHCENTKPSFENCPECGENLSLLGHGTERIEEVLSKLFPNSNIARIDRDSTRKKGTMNQQLKRIDSGEIDIMIGTQMLAKGHHFPNVTLTAIIDADRGLFSTDFRASERLAQLFMQVSGRSGRGDNPGTVIIQTHYPEHPLFHQLINNGYSHVSRDLLEERQQALLPPCTYMAFLRAEAHNSRDVLNFFEKSLQLLKEMNANLDVFGPLPSLIEKKSGRYRYQLIMQSNSRNKLHQHLDQWLLSIEQMRMAKKVRWSLDIDPQDMS